MKKILPYILLALGLFSCTVDEDFEKNPFVIAFKAQSTNYANINDEENINLVISESAKDSGFVKIKVETEVAKYGEDFVTIPKMENNYIIIPFSKGDTSLSFKFKNLIKKFSLNDQNKKINFTIVEINYRDKISIQGYSHHLISFDRLLGGTLTPEVGGPNEPNQVYIDLSTAKSYVVRRDTWDLGFYGGDDFRVILNGSIYMATKSLQAYDIDAINKESIPKEYFEEVKIGTFDPKNEEFIDHPSGDIKNTAIQEIKVEPSENSVYLLNLGYRVGAITPNVGSVEVAGEHKGWKKIRILRKDNGYLLQYADLNDSSHQEIFIPKEKEYNFTHFSFDTNQLLKAQPPKKDWDICFTVFTNLVMNGNNSAGSYGFSDFVVNNILADAKAFMVEDNTPDAFNNYVLNIDDANQQLLNDQRAIGGNWRNVFSGIKPDRFFIINDTDGNWYKIKFIAFTNEEGKRGFPKFQYEAIY